MLPVVAPGNATVTASCELVSALKKGRAMKGVVFELALKPVETSPRPKTLASTPLLRDGSNQ